MSGTTTAAVTTVPLIAFRLAETRQGDTLQVIATRELGDASRWVDLANLNGLLPPWITDDLGTASPTVLYAGQQVIKIPSASPAASGVADPSAVYGTDIALAGGRLSASATCDLVTIAGPDNLKQALLNRLDTPTQELVYHPDYGCDVYKLKGQGGTETVNMLAASLVARAVRSDKRVARAEGTTATIVGDTITVTGMAVSVAGKRIPTGIPSGPGAPPSV